MLRLVLCLFLATSVTCHQYSPFCQNWCNGQQRIVDPNACGTYCGGYTGSYNPCSSGYPYQYPVNVIFPGVPIGGSFPTIPNNPFPVRPSYPPIVWPGWPVVNTGPVGTDPLKVVVDTAPSNHKEWICPVDPQPRAGPISGSLPPTLTACEYDENCSNAPIRQKCCHDQGVGDKVCKPAVLA